MSTKIHQKRPIRIAGASGSVSDRRHAFASLAANYPSDPVDLITGDWMSESNMTTQATKAPGDIAYEPTFLEAISPALKDIAKYGIKVAVNAGASDTLSLYTELQTLIASQNLAQKLKVAWVSGDNVLPIIQSSLSKTKNDWINEGKAANGMAIKDAWMEGADVSGDVKKALAAADDLMVGFVNLCTGESLREWEWRDKIVGAQAYLGGLGIARAFEEGADVVVCGRVSDASPVIGGAVWWHGWDPETHLQEIANVFVGGHLVECSNYICGGNFTGFKQMRESGWKDIGYPIAEVGAGGEVVITKQKGTGGVLNVDTCKAQLLYEIQGPWYFNSDVTAILDEISFEQLSTNRVRMHGIKAGLPPPTTKIGITARGGYQAEVHWFLVGLDIEAKASMLELQIRDILSSLGPLSRFHVLKFTLHGTAAENPTDQNSSTVEFRVFAQARKVEDISPAMFLRPVIDLIMCAYPGATFNLDIRQGFPKPVQEYFVCLLPQSMVVHKVHLWDGREVGIEAPRSTRVWPNQQPSSERSVNVSVDGREWGETVRGPLGWLVHARSGDKGSNANVGFWVRRRDEYEWLRWLLSIENLKGLLAKEYNGGKIDRFELPNLWAVHFLLHDHLDRGVSCSSTYDFLGKNVAEFLRSRHVDLPIRFLNRGKL